LGHDEVNLLVTYIRSFQTEPSLKLSPAPIQGDAAAGRVLYEKRCIGCHGREGTGNTAISLNNRVFLETARDSYIRYAIAKGRRGTKMPSFEKRLQPEEIDNLTVYIRSLTGDDAALIEGEPPPSFEKVVVNPDGPMPRFSPLREGRYVPMAEVAAALEAGARLVFLDARAPSDWMRSHIPGALPVPYYDPERMADALPRDGTWILAYCACPHAASGRVMDRLRALGFENTAVIDEGILEWIKAGYPIASGKDPAP
ncbi:MAG: c-type cytochrome, partial [Myxococcota bacterium]